MRENIFILIICVIVNKVTAPAPFNLPSTNLPYPKTTTPPTPKLPKWADYASKNSAGKPIKDNAYLASLVKKPPKDNKLKIETKKAEEYKMTIEETESLNTTKVLFAEEFPSNTLAGKELNGTNVNSQVDQKLKSNVTEPRKGVKLIDLYKPLSLKPKVNNTENQNKSFEIPPTMIPIFRPKSNLIKSQITKEDLAIISTVPNTSPTTLTAVPNTAIRDLPTSVERAEQNTIPPNEAKSKSNLNSNLNAIPFNIPCHKASDVLDEVPAKPEILRASHAKLNPVPIATSPVSQEPNQVEKPEKLETDESVAIIFKPKNISLLNVYGDLLKKITLTVLVPYHISKLGT